MYAVIVTQVPACFFFSFYAHCSALSLPETFSQCTCSITIPGGLNSDKMAPITVWGVSLSLPDMCRVMGDPAGLANESQIHFTLQKAEVRASERERERERKREKGGGRNAL